MPGDLLSTLVGGLLALAGGFGGKYYSDWRLQQNLRSAFSGELRSMLATIKRQNLISELEKQLRAFEEGEVWRVASAVIPPEYNLVFKQNASKLGFLRAPLPEQIVSAYAQLSVVVHEFATVADAIVAERERGQQWKVLYDREVAHKFQVSLHKLLSDAVRDISTLIDDLDWVVGKYS